MENLQENVDENAIADEALQEPITQQDVDEILQWCDVAKIGRRDKGTPLPNEGERRAEAEMLQGILQKEVGKPMIEAARGLLRLHTTRFAAGLEGLAAEDIADDVHELLEQLYFEMCERLTDRHLALTEDEDGSLTGRVVKIMKAKVQESSGGQN